MSQNRETLMQKLRTARVWLFVLLLISNLFVGLVSTRQSAFAEAGVDWTEATPSASWPARGDFASVVYDNKMWVMGGTNGAVNMNDVWYSTNGVNWTQATANAGWSDRSGATSLVYDNKMWIIGGDGFNDVWYSTDGVNWTEATSSADWVAKLYFSSVVYDNKMWVMGGLGSGYDNDVWYSTDGVNWTEATSSANWTGRFGATSLVYDNKMWVMGGSSSGGNLNDVWYSTNGINWTQATSSAGWVDRYLHMGVVADNKMWVMGGSDGGGNLDDVWYSTNGVNWTEATSTADWDARSSAVSIVYDNKMWVMGGADSSFQYVNDVWYSQLPVPPPDPEDETTITSSVTGKQVILANSSDCDNEGVSIGTESATHPDPSLSYPLGLMNFTLDCGTQGITTTVTQTYLNESIPSGGYTARKFNSNTNTYIDVPGATITQTTLSGQPAVVLSYQITDGGVLDMDGTANGTIVDPVGLATPVGTLADTGMNQQLFVTLSLLTIGGAGLLLRKVCV